MSQRHYLLNTSILASDRLALADAVLKNGAKLVEVAETLGGALAPPQGE